MAPRRWLSSIGLTAVALLLIAGGLAACGADPVSPEAATTGTAQNDSARPTFPTAFAEQRAALATDIAKNTQVVAYRFYIATVVALTHAPTRTVGVPVYPTPTVELGILGGCTTPNSHNFLCYNAWRGYLDNHLADVLVGREGREGDPTQGEIIIFSAHQVTTWPAPGKTGALDIVSITGDLLTVRAIDSPNHETFVFNLHTHQWTPVTPTP